MKKEFHVDLPVDPPLRGRPWLESRQRRGRSRVPQIREVTIDLSFVISKILMDKLSLKKLWSLTFDKGGTQFSKYVLNNQRCYFTLSTGISY